MKDKKDNKTGFTLIEIIIAVAIFTVIMIIGTSALLSADTAYQVSHNQTALMDNLNFMMEDMTRNIRLGQGYYCDSGNPILNMTTSAPQILSDGPSGFTGMPTKDCPSFSYSFGFEPVTGDPVKNASDNGDHVVYVFAPWSLIDSNATSEDYKLFKSTDGGQTFSNMTPTAISIDNSKSGFIVTGSTPGDSLQPAVLITLSGTITYKKVVTPFNLETTVTQRANDNLAP